MSQRFWYSSYRTDEKPRLRRACASAQTRQSLGYSHTQTTEADEGSNQH